MFPWFYLSSLRLLRYLMVTQMECKTGTYCQRPPAPATVLSLKPNPTVGASHVEDTTVLAVLQQADKARHESTIVL